MVDNAHIAVAIVEEIEEAEDKQHDRPPHASRDASENQVTEVMTTRAVSSWTLSPWVSAMRGRNPMTMEFTL